MKTLLILAFGLVALVSCEKGNLFDNNKKDKACPVVAVESIPENVNTSFQTKYPGATVDKWFNKDNKGYCALFILNSKKTLSQFNNDGEFIKEETNVEQEGNHQDSEDNECECETEEGD